MRYLRNLRGHTQHLPPEDKSGASSSVNRRKTFRKARLVRNSKWLQSSTTHRQRYGRTDHVLLQDKAKTRYERIQAWTTAVAALTAIVALAFSAINYMQLNHTPVLHMVMPKVIRIAQGTWTDLYVAPTFTTEETTNVPAVISSVKVKLQGPPGTKEPPFYWWGIIEFVQDPNNTKLINFKYQSDPTPMIVTQSNPEHVHLRFETVNPAFSPGRWQGSFIAEQDGRPPLVAPLCIDISTTDLQTIERAAGDSYFYFRNDQPIYGARTSSPHCYRWAI